MKWRKPALIVAMVIMTVALVSVLAVSAGGPYGRWLKSGAQVFSDPDVASDVIATITETVPVSVTISTGWAEITAPPELAGYVESSALSKVETGDAKATREGRELEAQLQGKVGDMSLGDLLSFLMRLWLNGPAAVPAQAAQPAPPVASAPAASPTTYTVVSGDGWFVIANRLGVSVDSLLKANGATTSTSLHPGDKLVVPVGGAVVVAQAAPAAPASTSSWPATAEQFLALATAGQPKSDGTWRPIELTEVHRAVGEPNAWAVTREKDANNVIIPFWVNNFTSKKQDGYCQASNGKMATGCPVGFAGLSEGVTFRP